jgi:MFS family permease
MEAKGLEQPTKAPAPPPAVSGIGAPLRYPVFRNVWTAGVLSNLGTQIQTVGAAWAMTQLTDSAQLVAAVQSATTMPMMLFALVAGAMADLYDRRRVALAGLTVSLVTALLLTLLTWMGAATPALLLVFCFVAALGNTLYSPAWQSSVREQVRPVDLPPAIALNSISFNVGRSIGPAVGGAIVAVAGAAAAFLANALSFVPLIVALLFWRRDVPLVPGPREPLRRAVSLGIGFALNAPTIRVVLLRVVLNAAGGGALLALLPVVTRELLGGTALVYGLLLGGFGVGAILGAFIVPSLRRRYSTEAMVRTAAMVSGAMLITVGLSQSAFLTAAALVPAGACWTVASATFNVSVQLSAPRWVSGRAVAMFQAAISGGTAVGSLFWGGVAAHYGVVFALIGAGLYLAVAQCVGLAIPLPRVGSTDEDVPDLVADPEVRVPVDGRSGPITILIHYRIAPENIAKFRKLMSQARLSRKRNGASGWTLGRDMVDPELWIERYSFATWNDYLRFRNRPTMAERRLLALVRSLHAGDTAPTVYRTLERPTESMVPTDGAIAAPTSNWAAQ